MLFKKYESNLVGNDYVFGDIHGMYDYFKYCLKDKSKNRHEILWNLHEISSAIYYTLSILYCQFEEIRYVFL